MVSRHGPGREGDHSTFHYVASESKWVSSTQAKARWPIPEATWDPCTKLAVSALAMGPAWAAPTVPGSMASGKDPHDTTFSRIHTPTGLISTRKRVIEPKNEINNRPIVTPVLAPGRPVPKSSSTGFPPSFVPTVVWNGLQWDAEHESGHAWRAPAPANA